MPAVPCQNTSPPSSHVHDTRQEYLRRQIAAHGDALVINGVAENNYTASACRCDASCNLWLALSVFMHVRQSRTLCVHEPISIVKGALQQMTWHQRKVSVIKPVFKTSTHHLHGASALTPDLHKMLGKPCLISSYMFQYFKDAAVLSRPDVPLKAQPGTEVLLSS